MLVMDFLDKICCLNDGTTAPVYIYAGGGDFYPDDSNDLKEAELIALYQSDYKAEFVLSKRVCQMSIEEIFWTAQGIVITALELGEYRTTAKWLDSEGNLTVAECSSCGEVFDVSDPSDDDMWRVFTTEYKFCPYCGAKMEDE